MTMTHRTRTILHKNRAFIVISKSGPTWHSGWSWETHEALPLTGYVGHPAGARRFSVGPIRSRGTAPWRIMALVAARNHADRITS